jgi:hypothetical protein
MFKRIAHFFYFLDDGDFTPPAFGGKEKEYGNMQVAFHT